MSVTLFSLLPLSVNRASALADQNDRCSEIFAVDATQRAVDCPSAPTGVRVLPADQGVEVSWDATAIENSVDDTSANTTTNDVNTATSFQVKLSPGDIVVNVAATSHTALVSGLMNGKVYEVTVVAINEFGASEIVGPLSVTPTSGLEGVVGQLVVQYEDGVDATASDGTATGSESVDNVELTSSVDLGEGLHTVELSESVTEAEARVIIDELESDPRIAWVEVDEILLTADVSDPDYSTRQWNLWGEFGIDRSLRVPEPLTDSISGANGQGVAVAVIDTGIAPHSDLGQQVLQGYDFVSDRLELWAARGPEGDRVAFDGDYVDPETFGSMGWDANPADPGDWRGVAPVRPSSWHGTHVAGIIGAQTNNGIGIAGVASGARIVPIRALSWNGGLSSDVAAAIIWAAGGHIAGVDDNQNPARIINLSMASRAQCSATLQTAIDTATELGSVVVVAAGNANSDVRDYSPANCEQVISVGATDATGSRANYSNFGDNVDVYAPGGDLNASGDLGIYSLSNAGVREPDAEAYAYRQGTSMAAAHISGLLARLISAQPSITTSELRNALNINEQVSISPTEPCVVDVQKTCDSSVVEIAAAPSSPTGLVLNADVRAVAMKWTPSTDTTVTGLRVQWGASAGALTNQFTVGGRTVESFIHSGNPVRVMNKGLTTNVATITTAVAHGLGVGQVVTVACVTATTLNGTFTIASVPTTTTFTYALTATNVTSAADTGTVTFTNNYRAIVAGREALAEAQAADISTVIGPEIDALRRFRTIGWYYFGGFARLREAALFRIESAATNG